MLMMPSVFAFTLDSCAMEHWLWLLSGHICSPSYSYLWDITQNKKVPLNYWDSWYENELQTLEEKRRQELSSITG